jgi:hypothetical protein
MIACSAVCDREVESEFVVSQRELLHNGTMTSIRGLLLRVGGSCSICLKFITFFKA